MSHLVVIEPVIENLEALERAAASLGGKLVRGQTTFKWYGEVVGDYNEADAAQNRGIDIKDFGKCDHAIVFPAHMTTYGYEIGVVHQGDNYRVVFDHYDPQLKKLVDGPECYRLIKEYERASIEMQAESLGLQYTTELVEDSYVINVQEGGYG